MEDIQLFRKITDMLPIGIVVFDLDGSVLYRNTAAQEFMEKLEKHGSRSLQEQARSFIGSSRSGDTLPVLLAGRPQLLTYHDRIEDGRRVGAIVYITDNADRHQQEFAANVSHELKTPLTSISGYAEMIENGMAKPEDISKFASRINRESQRMLKLVSDIIKLTELDETEIMEESEQVDLYALAKENIEILESAAMRHNTTIRLSGETAIVNGNRSLLSELIYNLIDNAIRYNRDNGSVVVRVHHDTLSVWDSGIGIPRAHQTRIFDRFYRVDKSHSKATGGTGLGLSIVKEIAEQHHAQIRLESREGIGTEITVTFPTFHED